MNIKGNICVQERFGGRIYLYTHTHGFDTFDILKAALIKGKSKWNDEQYLTRIIFCELIKRDLNGISNYGISSFVAENDLPIFVVDVYNSNILLEDGRCLSTCLYPGVIWDFKEFISLKEDPRFERIEN